LQLTQARLRSAPSRKKAEATTRLLAPNSELQKKKKSINEEYRFDLGELETSK